MKLLGAPVEFAEASTPFSLMDSQLPAINDTPKAGPSNEVRHISLGRSVLADAPHLAFRSSSYIPLTCSENTEALD